MKKLTCHDCTHYYFDLVGNECMALRLENIDTEEAVKGCDHFLSKQWVTCPWCGILTEELQDGLCSLCYDETQPPY